MSDEKKRIDAPKETSERRTLVLCFDGTANQFDETNTNIVHIFALLEKEDPRQLVYYQTGVGTYVGPSVTTPVGKWFSKWADVGMAWYLDEHVIDGYQFLQSNYRKGDKICLFGFSRGAYTARALAGMLYTIGLLPRSMPEQVEFAYRIFKQGKATAIYKRSFCRPVKIEFLGLFDTVSSVGGIIPRVLPFSVDNHITKTFRHALSLDERRAKFRSNGWHLVHPDIHLDKDGMPVKGRVNFFEKLALKRGKASMEAEIQQEEKEAAEADGEQVQYTRTDVKEVWFAGGHCDVGGGNELDTEPYKLSNIPLRWMLREIIHADTGIIFNRRKLMKFGVPGTEFAPRATKLPGSNTNKVQISPPNAKLTQQPTVVREVTMKDESNRDPGEDDDDSSGSAPAGNSVSAKRPVSEMTSGGATIIEEGSEEDVPWWYRDSLEPMRDELLHQPGWWILEILPFYIKKQDEHSVWKKHLRVNRFRPRVIPAPPHIDDPNHPDNDHEHGAQMVPHTLVHLSVKTRMESPEANERTWRSLWMKKDRPYKPRAWPTHGDPVYVE